ncbi:unnamed protein product, partial [Prorocentrum cordatum]
MATEDERSKRLKAEDADAQMRAYVDKAKTELLAAVATVSDKVGSSFESLATRMEERCSGLQGQIDGHDKRVKTLEDQVKALQSILGIMQKETPQPPPADPAFDRMVDTTILIARAKQLVAKDAMERALQPWF